MGTATSRAAAGAIAALVAVALAACGSRSPAPFAWLHPSAAPAGWPVASIPAGASVPYPPGWRRVHGDSGTASAMLTGPGDRVLGYLNVTPRQGAETQANWARFRPGHDADEGARGVRTLAAARGLRFRDGRGACVQDSYTTSTGARYVEIACLVSGSRGTAVVVGAAPPSSWATRAPQIERAISSFST